MPVKQKTLMQRIDPTTTNHSTPHRYIARGYVVFCSVFGGFLKKFNFYMAVFQKCVLLMFC